MITVPSDGNGSLFRRWVDRGGIGGGLPSQEGGEFGARVRSVGNSPAIAAPAANSWSVGGVLRQFGALVYRVMFGDGMHDRMVEVAPAVDVADACARQGEPAAPEAASEAVELDPLLTWQDRQAREDDAHATGRVVLNKSRFETHGDNLSALGRFFATNMEVELSVFGQDVERLDALVKLACKQQFNGAPDWLTCVEKKLFSKCSGEGACSFYGYARQLPHFMREVASDYLALCAAGGGAGDGTYGLAEVSAFIAEADAVIEKQLPAMKNEAYFEDGFAFQRGSASSRVLYGDIDDLLHSMSAVIRLFRQFEMRCFMPQASPRPLRR